MKYTFILLLSVSIACSQNPSENIASETFKTELDILINYLNSKKSKVKFIELNMINSNTFSLIPSEAFSKEHSKGYFLYNGKYIVLDKKMGDKITEKLIGINLKDSKLIDCSECRYEESEDYIDPVDFFIYGYNDNLFTIKSGGIDDIKTYVKVRSR